MMKKSLISLLFLLSQFLSCNGSLDELYNLILTRPILFVSDRDGSNAIYVMKSDGNNVIKLTNGTAAQWSYDGNLIVFERSDRIWIMNADGSNAHQVADIGYGDYHPSFSPDGRIAFTTNHGIGVDFQPSIYDEVFTMNSDGTGQTNITRSGNTERQPSWSPDGNRIAYVNQNGTDYRLFLMNSDGSNQVVFQNSSGLLDIQPSWSTDGSRIVFTSNRDGNNEIYRVNSDGSNLTRLTNNSSSDSEPCFSPDGSRIVFTSDRDGNNEIYIMNADGTGQTRITNNSSSESRSRWNPAAF